MIALMKKAKQLHEKAVADGEANTLDPNNWIANEDVMREGFAKLVNIENPVIRCIGNTNNSLYVYMKFVCDSYPHGIGNAIKNSYHNGSDFDGCETFVRLGGKVA